MELNEIANGTEVKQAVRGGTRYGTVRGFTEDSATACIELATGRLVWVPVAKLSRI